MSRLKEDPKLKSMHYFLKDGSGERGYCIYFQLKIGIRRKEKQSLA